MPFSMSPISWASLAPTMIAGSPVSILQGGERTTLEVAQRFAGGQFRLGIDAFESDLFVALRAGDDHRVIEHGRNRNDMRNFAEPGHEIAPVRNTGARVFIENVDVRGGREHVALERVLEIRC